MFVISANRQPFNLRFLTDNFESMGEAVPGTDLGFRLSYIQSGMNCA